MIVYEFKVKGKQPQFDAIDEVIRTSQFIQNSCIRYWIDSQGVDKYDLNKYCAVLADVFPFADKLNSMARQSAAERAWSAISRFYTALASSRETRPTQCLDNCKKKKPGKKGFSKFKKHCRSVEYKTSGWKLSENRKAITFRDGKGIGTLKLKGTYDLNFYHLKQIKRVRLVRRADGYYTQFCIDANVRHESNVCNSIVGIDLGLKYFIADSQGLVEVAPQFYRKAEKGLNRANRQKSKKYRKGAKPQTKNYHKVRKRYARKHLRVSRQRKEYCKKLAYSVIQSNDLVAYEDRRPCSNRIRAGKRQRIPRLNMKGLVRNCKLAKPRPLPPCDGGRVSASSISDAGWSTFRNWIEYLGIKYGKITVAVPPHYTSQECSNCGHIVKKALSVRTHVCPHCKYVADRDINASINILKRGLSTTGHVGIYASGDLPSWTVGVNLLSNGESLNEESPRL